MMRTRSGVVAGIGLCLVAAACGGGGTDGDAAVRTSVVVPATSARTALADTTAAPTPSVTEGPTTSAPSSADPTPAPRTGVSVITDEVVDNPAFDALEARIVKVVGDAGLPGASLLVVHDGEVVEQEAWLGYDLDTRVPIASATKWLSAATIMTLVDEGRLALDAPISTYVAELEGRPTGRITLRQLLSFTSGLRSDEADPCSADPDVSLAECTRRLVSLGLRHEPGAEYRYDSVHLRVAATLAELVTGVPFAELFQQRIAGPLGMDRTYYFQVADADRTPVDHPNPAGSAASTLGDYGRFLEMIVRGGVAPDGTQVLSEAAISEMEANQTEGLPVYGAAFRRKNRTPYGLGHWIDWTYPDGATMVSSSPGKFGFRPWVDWENDLFGVYLVRDQRETEDLPSGDPDASSAGGVWILSMAADAVGGSLPEEFFPHRG